MLNSTETESLAEYKGTVIFVLTKC
jgi:hypothetical protein